MTRAKSKHDRIENSAAAFGGAMAGSIAAAPDAAATDVINLHMQELRRVGAQYANLAPDKAKGFLFEHILAAKFNADAARKGLDVRAVVTASEGDPHGAADLLIKRGDEVLQRVQAKASDSSTALTRYLNDDKYAEMTKVVPSDKADHVRDIASGLAERHAERGAPTAAGHADTARNVTGELKEGGASSGSTTHKETLDAARDPQGYAVKTELRYVGQEALSAGASAAVAGAVIGGALSGVKNGIAAFKGEKTIGEAATDTAKDAGKAGAKGGLAGAGGALIRYGAGKAGLQGLAKSNVATATAAAVVEIGGTVLAYAKGEISGEQAMIQIGQTGLATAGGIFVGAAAGAVFGPAGAVVGSMVGYMVTAYVYQATLAVLQNARLATAEAERLEALSREACRQLQAERAEFEALVEDRLQQRREAFSIAFLAVDAGLSSGSYEQTLDGLGQLTSTLGANLKFSSLEEFEDFMESDAPLVL